MPCLIAPLACSLARIAPWSPPTSSSLATIRRVCSFLLTAAGRDAVFDCSARSLARGSRLGARLLRRRSQTIRRVCSFLLTAAGRDAVFDCSARFARSADRALESAYFVVARRR